jgi:hypothetical protein
MKCVVKEENVRKVEYDVEPLKGCTLVLQLEKQNDEGTSKVVIDTPNSSIANQQGRWVEIKSNINVDLTLDPVKVDNLWQLLEEFFDVFA